MTSTSLFTKNLGQNLADASNICQITATGFSQRIGFTLSVVQTNNKSVNRLYRVDVPKNATGEGVWKRLAPYDKTENFPNQNHWAVDMTSVDGVATLRLVRTKVGSPASTTDLTCKVIAYASAGETIAVANSETTSSNAINAGVFEGAILTQMDGKLAINSDNPEHTLDVAGNVNTSNGSYKIAGADVLTSTALGSGILQSSLTSVGTLSSLEVNGNVFLQSLASTATGNVLHVDPSTGKLTYAALNIDSITGGSGNLTVSNLTANTISGLLTTASQPNITSVGTLESLNVSGNVTSGNLSTNTITATAITGTLQTSAQPNITSLGELSTLSVTGNASLGNVSTNTITATAITGTLQTASQPNITSVGTLSSLDVTGTANAATFSATTLTGTLSTAAQPNITSIGTLSTLDVSGNVALGNLSTNAITATAITGTLQTASQPNITSLGELSTLSVTGNASLGNVSTNTITATAITGTLQTASQPNITSLGTLSSLDVTGMANASTFSATTLTGTLSTSAQPNITSVGTLGSLTVSGNATFGNVSTNAISATTVTGTLQTASQPNITAVGTLGSLNVSGVATAANVTATDVNVSGNLRVNGSIWASSVVYGTTTPFTYTGPGSAYSNGVSFFAQTSTNGTPFVTAGGTNNNIFTFATAGTYMLQAELETGYPWFPEGDINTYYVKNGDVSVKFGGESHSPSNFSCTRPYLITVNASDNVRFIVDSSSGNDYEAGINASRLTMLKF
jgi:hypothetical protein